MTESIFTIQLDVGVFSEHGGVHTGKSLVPHVCALDIEVWQLVYGLLYGLMGPLIIEVGVSDTALSIVIVDVHIATARLFVLTHHPTVTHLQPEWFLRCCSLLKWLCIHRSRSAWDGQGLRLWGGSINGSKWNNVRESHVLVDVLIIQVQIILGEELLWFDSSVNLLLRFLGRLTAVIATVGWNQGLAFSGEFR